MTGNSKLPERIQTVRKKPSRASEFLRVFRKAKRPHFPYWVIVRERRLQKN